VISGPTVTAIGVRGTFERWSAPHSGMGTTVSAVVDRLQQYLRVRRPDVQLKRIAVEYPASLWRYPRSRNVGAERAVHLLSEEAAHAPQQRFVLIGLSQGADVVRRALGSDHLGETTAERIAAVILLGDPTRDPRRDNCIHEGPVDRPGLLARFATPVPTQFAGRVWSYCLEGDEVACNHRGWVGAILSGTHTHYEYNGEGVLDVAGRFATDLLVTSEIGSRAGLWTRGPSDLPKL
jgi:cutinase